MSNEAATPTGGAETSARPDVSQQPKASVHDRLKAALFAPQEPEPDPERATPEQRQPEIAQAPAEPKAPQEQQQAAPQEQEAEQPTEGAQDEAQEAEYSTVEELAEALGWDLDRVLGLDVKTKIDGKEGTARLRDLIKSHQLEGHLNQKLMTFAEEKKAFEAETARKVGEYQQRVGQLNQAVVIAQKILDGEFADVNWQELQRTDPAEFQAKYGAYTMRLDGIRQLAQLTAQETERQQAQQQAAYQAYLAEQTKLLNAKVPEWGDKAKRDKDVAEMAAIVSEAYGLTEEELKSAADHRHILILRDAVAYRKLQKAKPAIVNKVKTAPKLLKPGVQQSRASQEGLQLQQDRERLRKSGSVKDAARVLKRQIFN